MTTYRALRLVSVAANANALPAVAPEDAVPAAPAAPEALDESAVPEAVMTPEFSGEFIAAEAPAPSVAPGLEPPSRRSLASSRAGARVAEYRRMERLADREEPLSPLSLAIAAQPQAIQDLNARFVASERPHVLIINPQGYAGPTFPFSARDSGGQLTYINAEARELVAQGYKVTVVARSFRPEPRYRRYGDRTGVAFMERTDDFVRYAFVPGAENGKARFMPKEEIYKDMDAMSSNLWKFVKEEGRARGLDPWDRRNVAFLNSHYVDGGLLGQLLVRRAQSRRVVHFLVDRFGPILGIKDGQHPFNTRYFLGNVPYYFGVAVLNAFCDRWSQDGSHDISGGTPSVEEVLRWAGDRLGLTPEDVETMLQDAPTADESAESLSPTSIISWEVGRRLLRYYNEEFLELKGVLREVDNRSAWTLHSVGLLKERRMIESGAVEREPDKYVEGNFVTRRLIEVALMARKYDPLKTALPPARIIVETSPEIADAAFWEGRSGKKDSISFVPGTDERFFPRESVDAKDVRALFRRIRGTKGVAPAVIDAMVANPQQYNIVVEASRMDVTKRKVMAIEAMKDLPSNTILFMTGTGEGKDRPLYDALVQKIREYGLTERVFLVGRMPDRLMGPLCSLPHGKGDRQFRLAAFLITSRMEGWGMAAQDSVVGGLPLVASKYTPVGTYLRRKDAAAIVVDDDRASKFADALRLLIDYPGPAREMAARGQEVTKDFTWKALTRHFAEETAERLMLGGFAAFPTSLNGE